MHQGKGERPRIRFWISSIDLRQSILQVSVNILGACFRSWSLDRSRVRRLWTVVFLPVFHQRYPFTVSTKTLAPISFILSCTSPAVSFSSIGKLSCIKMFPVSISCLSLKVVTPVSFSPFITAQLIELHRGIVAINYHED